MSNRLLYENEVVKVLNKHIIGDRIFGEVSDIIEKCVPTAHILSNKTVCVDNSVKISEKQKRVELFENDDIILEQRGNRYYLSLYDKEGNFQREVTIDVKDDYKVALCNGK